MSAVFFEEMEIPKPNYNLGIGSGSHSVQTAQMLTGIEELLLKENPDYVLIYGDTNSTLAGTLAATKLHIPVAHVEAGLRSFNKRMPEEINRVLADRISDILFAPTETAVSNLQQEGIPEEQIFLVGDVMYDAALYYATKAESHSYLLDELNLQRQNYILATVHRAENTDDSQRLQAIFEALINVSQQIPIVLPLHPRTRKALQREQLLEKVSQSLQIIEPVGYLDMVMLEKNARLIATDSGGVQKEAFFYQVPCVTLREETEWVELVELGFNKLILPTKSTFVTQEFLSSLNRFQYPTETPTLYGGGQATQNILKSLITK
jgi:UDP-GlcNAc3NAcA epimerase